MAATSDDGLREGRIAVYLSADERAAAEEAARHAGLSRSSWARVQLLDALRCNEHLAGAQ